MRLRSRSSHAVRPGRALENRDGSRSLAELCLVGIHKRRGLTLLEILLSVALFLGAVTVLSQLWHSGVRAAVQARLQTQAVLRCESKMNEAIAGAIALQTTSETPFDDDDTWTWKLTVEPGPQTNILKVTVEALHPGQGGLSNSSHQLVRWVRDPQVWVDAQQTTTETEP